MSEINVDHELDCRGMNCPLPVLKARRAMNSSVDIRRCWNIRLASASSLAMPLCPPRSPRISCCFRSRKNLFQYHLGTVWVVL